MLGEFAGRVGERQAGDGFARSIWRKTGHEGGGSVRESLAGAGRYRDLRSRKSFTRGRLLEKRERGEKNWYGTDRQNEQRARRCESVEWNRGYVLTVGPLQRKGGARVRHAGLSTGQIGRKLMMHWLQRDSASGVG